LADNCAGVEGNGLPLCAVANCAPAFTEVSMGCQQCIAANQAATDVENLTTLCAATDASRVAYADQTGLLLLSRLPLSALDYLQLESSLGDRGVLSARVQTDFAGSVQIFCTHLAASLGDVPYTGPHGSWEGERLQQIETFLQQLDLTRAPGSSVALLGDLNTGPETLEARAASPEGFERFVSAGFEDPYVDADGRCTFCSNNPLNGFSDAVDEGAILDHVLLAGFGAGLSRVASRVFDDVIVISDAGQDVETARSDHYGVRVTVSESAESAAQ
jgi:endonuclease/exonuclease/phosphatase family metal-dependent hydrolase